MKSPSSQPQTRFQRVELIMSSFLRMSILSWTVAVVAALLIYNIAYADFFGGRYADNDQHRFASIETNDAHHSELDPFVTDSMYWDYEVDTDEDINTINDGHQSGVPGTHVDVYWFASDKSQFSKPSVLGDATCMVTMSNNKCDQFRIRFNEDKLIDHTDSQKEHTVCHEIGHTLGSDDGSTDSEGCWPTSAYSTDGDLSDHEIAHLKDRY